MSIEVDFAGFWLIEINEEVTVTQLQFVFF